MSAPISEDSVAGDHRADVELRLPGDGAFASVLRTTAAALAARLDFTIDDIEDLRIAVGEAGALVLSEADPGAGITARFHLSAGRITVEVSTASTDNPEPDLDTFAWQVPNTLSDDATVEAHQGVLRARFTMTSALGAGAAHEPAGA